MYGNRMESVLKMLVNVNISLKSETYGLSRVVYKSPKQFLQV